MKFTQFIPLVAVVLALGCDSETTEAVAENDLCPGFRTAFDSYTAGIEKDGAQGLVTVRLVDADPAPPDRGQNAWTLQMVDTSTGAEVDDVTIGGITPFMPDHGHGTSIAPTHACQDDTCDVDDIDFRMPGVWQVTFELMTADSQADSVVFSFCIEG